MTDRLQIGAERTMAMLERRFGMAATYVKRGTPTVAADGTVTQNTTSVACTLVPGELTQRDLEAVGSDFLEQTLRIFKARKSVLGDGASKGDVATVGATTYEVIAPVLLDGLGVTFRLITREIA